MYCLYVVRIEFAACFRAMVFLCVEQEWVWCWKRKAAVPRTWPNWHLVIIHILIERRSCTYNSVSKGGSAEWSGRVRVGDRLITVDGNDVSGRTPSELSQIITGPDGSKVRSDQCCMLSHFRNHEMEDCCPLRLGGFQVAGCRPSAEKGGRCGWGSYGRGAITWATRRRSMRCA